MSEMKRRDFLKSGTMAVAAAGVAAAIPIVPAVINAVDTEGPKSIRRPRRPLPRSRPTCLNPRSCGSTTSHLARCRCSSELERWPTPTLNSQLAFSEPPSEVQTTTLREAGVTLSQPSDRPSTATSTEPR